MHRMVVVGAALVFSLLLGVGTQAITSYAEPTVKTASGDLATHLNSFVAAMPREGSGSYDVPTTSERSTMAATYDAIEAGDLSRAASLADPLGYDVVRHTDTVTGRNLILLSERQNADGSWPHAWGMYVFFPAATSDTAVEVAHPVSEVNVEEVGVETFREANAEDLFIAGAHRYTNSDGSADVAHANASVFEDIHKAAIESSTKVFQPHGFSQASHPDCGEVVVSAGTAPPTELARKVNGDLRSAGFNAVLYDGVSCRELGATTNVQGASTRAIGANFLHVEVSRPIRDAAARRSLLSGTIAGALGSSSGTQVSLLPPSQIGAQASADIGFANLTPPQTQDRVRHVDPNGADNVAGTADDGSDTNPGTRELPWKTIGKAAGTLRVDGLQVAYVHGGTYNERVTTGNSGSATVPLWLLEAPGESAVIKGDGSSSNPFVRITKPYWVVDGFEIDAGGSQNHAIRFQTDSALGFDASHVVIRNVEVHHGTGPAAVVFQGASDAALLNSKVHDYKFGSNDSHGVAVLRGSKRILVKGNDSWGNDGDDVQCADADAVSSADDPVDITIEGNRYGNTHPGGAPRPSTRENAVDIKTCDNVTVRGNKMFGFRPSPIPCPGNCSPHGDAVVIHENASRILMEGNRIWNGGRGVSIGGSNGTLGPIVFRRNLIFDMATGTGLSTDTVGSGNGIRISFAPDAEIYQNTFYNLRGTAIAVGDAGGSVARADVINNIVQKAGTGFIKGSVSSFTVQKNLFWETPQGVPPESIVADPMFVDDPRNNDYHTKPGSPARDVALHEPLAVDGANSTYCHEGPDIGFLESCASETQPTEPQPSTLAYAPTNDAHVEEANASTNYGGSSTLRTDGGAGTRVDTYLQYAVANIPAGEKVQSAKLRLWDTDNGTADGPAVYTSASGWSESTITWANKPVRSSSGVADQGAIASASWVEFDVTPLVTGNATYSFVFSQPGTDGANYASKEHGDATKKPQLVVTTGTTTSATLVGACDIATSGSDDEATARLVRSIPGTVFTTGDNVYESGTDTEFNDLYHPTWGTEKGRTMPSVGNHEYANLSDASGYFNYFGAAAGERGKGYYSYDRGDWHIIALNSMCASSESSCDHMSQLTWLKNDLAANPRMCTLAYFHHPLFSSGVHGDDAHVPGWVKPLWDALYAANADVVVNGHDHSYERFAPQRPDGTLDQARGISEFVVGTGGTSLRPFETEKPHSEIQNATAHGVLKLTLNSTSYDWQFVPVAGKTFTDSGSTNCH
jgi:acid phosphatase type 7